MADSLFIPAKSDLRSGDTSYLRFINLDKKIICDRWKTDEAKVQLTEILNRKFDKKFLEDNVGKLNGKYDLRGVDFSECDLSNMNLSNIDFYNSNFKKSKLIGVDLNGSYLSESDVRGTNFNWAKFDSDTLIDNLKFNRNTTFDGVDFQKMNFTYAVLIQDLIITQQRIGHLKRRSPQLAFLLMITTDYGRSLTRWSIWCFGVIFFFAWLYLKNNAILYAGHDKLTFYKSLYFSVITFTTVGYGDVLPISTIGRILTMTEAITGIVMGGLLVAILTKKVIGSS